MKSNALTAGSFSSDHAEKITVPGLDFSSVPLIGVLSAHFKGDEEDSVKATLRRHGAQLTTDVSKVKVFIGKVGSRKRAEFELRSRKFEVEEVVDLTVTSSPAENIRKRPGDPFGENNTPRKKNRAVGSTRQPITIRDEDSTTEDENEEGSETEDEDPEKALNQKEETPMTSPIEHNEALGAFTSVFNDHPDDDLIWIVKVDWLNECLSAGHVVPLGENLVYKCKVKHRPPASLPTPYHSTKPTFIPYLNPASQSTLATRPQSSPQILARAQADNKPTSPKSKSHSSHRSSTHPSHHFTGRSFAPTTKLPPPAPLLPQTTSSYEGEGEDSDTPPPPPWVLRNLKYSCQRFTPSSPPNQPFIALLKKIRTARTLLDDAIGVRAYSSIIAAIAAYPHELRHPREIARLPGCDEKAVGLFVEWKNTGVMRAVEEFEEDEAMNVLRVFYDIWGVGAKTARAFYFGKGWRDLDDIVEYGWSDLDRVQQIGVKFYEEFLRGIPRKEVEAIAQTIRRHCVRLRDDRISITLVGGYRRGKLESGDVDVVVSHPDLSATAGLIREIVESLEDQEWITHTLSLSLNNTARGQTTLPFRTTKAAGAGFDTLDKALVVWQDVEWPSREADRAADPRAKNPNVHRRVDIIVAPWRTVGCAVMGWSGGTTFQRDLRRYAKYVKGWKFDSSGIRRRDNGEVVQLEGPDGVSGTAEDAEKAVFEGLGLEYIPPEMRCTN